MYLSDREIQEWHEYVVKDRERLRRLARAIVEGIPRVTGMASEYRELSLKEIKTRAAELIG